MATRTRPRSSGSSSLEDVAERALEPALVVAGAVLALVVALPLLLVAASVWLGLSALRTRSWRIKAPALALCVLPALVALLWAHAAGGVAPGGVAMGYVNTQLDAAVAVVGAWPDVAWGPLALAYGLAVWPYAVAGGLLLGGAGFLLCGGCSGGTARNELRAVSADALGQDEGTREPQPVDGFTARGRLTAITALPKQGKTFAWFGLLRARQDGGRWFGRRVLPGKTLVMTEEDRGTFAAKVKRFGIKGAALVSVHAPETADARFGQEAWPALLEEAARLARRKGCDTLCMDTLTTWAPWAFRGPEQMSYALRTLKAACGRHKLAGVVVLHNRKQQSDLGAVVDMLGTIAGSAAYDVVAGFSREKDTGECTLAVDGRLGEWQCTALLEGGRYVPVAGRAATAGDPDSHPDSGPSPRGTPLPSHLRPTLDQLPADGSELTTAELLALDGGGERALRDRLRELERLELVARRGRGVKGDPVRWRRAGAPAAAQAPPEAIRAIRDDPAYVAYLNSPAWAGRRLEALRRAGGRCQRCGDGTPAAEVHHLTYERIGAELPDDLEAVCAPCHRRAHPAA
jgi:AAA domain/HNH endonuclease